MNENTKQEDKNMESVSETARLIWNEVEIQRGNGYRISDAKVRKLIDALEREGADIDEVCAMCAVIGAAL